VDLSGGEKKRNEILQMAVLATRLALLDETDSGLDVDSCAFRFSLVLICVPIAVIASLVY